MLKRLILTLTALAMLAVGPWITALVLTIGKLGTFAVLGTRALAFWVSGVANVLERNDQ